MLSSLSRKELQSLAKSHGIKANQTSDKLIKAISLHVNTTSDPTDDAETINKAETQISSVEEAESQMCAVEETKIPMSSVKAAKIPVFNDAVYYMDGDKKIMGTVKRVNKKTVRVVRCNGSEVSWPIENVFNDLSTAAFEETIPEDTEIAIAIEEDVTVLTPVVQSVKSIPAVTPKVVNSSTPVPAPPAEASASPQQKIVTSVLTPIITAPLAESTVAPLSPMAPTVEEMDAIPVAPFEEWVQLPWNSPMVKSRKTITSVSKPNTPKMASVASALSPFNAKAKPIAELKSEVKQATPKKRQTTVVAHNVTPSVSAKKPRSTFGASVGATRARPLEKPIANTDVFPQLNKTNSSSRPQSSPHPHVSKPVVKSPATSKGNKPNFEKLHQNIFNNMKSISSMVRKNEAIDTSMTNAMKAALSSGDVNKKRPLAPHDKAEKKICSSSSAKHDTHAAKAALPIKPSTPKSASGTPVYKARPMPDFNLIHSKLPASKATPSSSTKPLHNGKENRANKVSVSSTLESRKKSIGTPTSKLIKIRADQTNVTTRFK